MSGAELKWHGDEAKALVQQASQKGLTMGAEHLRGVAQQLAPIDEGTLRASAAVTPISAKKVAVSFNTPYAVRQHEELGYRHPKGGQAKYLEQPLRTEAWTIQDIVRRYIKGVLG